MEHMKKVFKYISILILIGIILSGCTRTAPGNDETPAPEPVEENRVLVAYFSITGHTAKVAEEIYALTEGDIYEIVPLYPYEEEDLQYYVECRSTVEQSDPTIRPEIGSPDLDMSSYSVIFIGYPIWYGEEPRILDTFVEKYDFEGKTVIPFCTSDNSPIGDSGKNLESNAGSGSWLEGMRFPADFSKEDVEDFVREVMK